MSSLANRLSLPRVLAFASVGIPMAAVGLPMAVFVAPLYAENLGLGTTLVGLIFMILRFWDLLTDPFMGWLVDTRPTRRGRIKHWIYIGAPILGIGAFFMFIPGESVTPVYLVISLAVLWLGFTMIQTPHQSWVPLIAHTYDERSRVFMWREVVQTATLISLLVIPFILSEFYEFGRRDQVKVMGVIVIVSLPISVLLAARFVPDMAPNPDAPRTRFSWQHAAAAFRDRSVLRVATTEILVGIAIASTGGTYLFMAQWGFGVTDYAPLILLAFFATGFACLPFWTWVSRKTEKHIALQIICIWSSITYMAYLPLSLMGAGMTTLLIAAVVSGVGYGAPFILARSMMADIIEQNTVRTGDNRAGFYYSLMTGAYKTGASLAIGISYIMLGSIVGFNPSGENSPGVVRGLMYVFVGVPAVAYGLTALVMWKYPLTRNVQAKTDAARHAAS